MANTSKRPSDQDGNQVLQGASVVEDSSLMVSGFLVGKVGRKVELAISTTNVANDTETFTFSESGTTLYVLELIYTDGSRETLESAERIA